jgi:hypothetical protein
MKPRRDFLASLLHFAGLSALAATPASLHAEFGKPTKPPAKTPEPPKELLADLPTYARAQNYRSLKQSSYDRQGGNYDWFRIDPGVTKEVFSATGPGIISHLWFTLSPPRGQDALKRITLRIFWDGNPKPSVEVPLGDFFGLNTAEFFPYQSAFLNTAPRAFNCYFAMPFQRSARITITNEAFSPTDFFSNIDYKLLPSLPPDALYFHAQYRQAVPNIPAKLDRGLNLDAKNNYVFLETRGRGHLMGVTLGVIQTSDGWWGEGDDMTFIDDESTPAINGTGAEDYFNAGYSFPTAFAYDYIGCPYIVDPNRINGRYCAYRWHADNPITFTKYLKHTLEHGSGNDRADCYYSVAYWYQSEPYTDFPPLPPPEQRTTQIAVTPTPAP